MTTITGLPDMTRTANEIEKYDEMDEAFDKIDLDDEDALKALNEIEAQGEAVGIAFGHDTADRNNMDTCRRYVHPGFKNCQGGESFVRRMVRRWKEEELS